MSAFRLRKDSKSWFKDLYCKGGFSIDFDAYYYCLVAGIAAERTRELPVSDTSELVEYFPGRYKDRSKVIVALFLSRELGRLGVDLTEKKAAHNVISSLVRPESPNHLSDEGTRQMNHYAAGGFEVLTEWFEDRPRTLEVFLQLFFERLNSDCRPFVL
jgi:hypothetical protein